jgi:DNA repair exonuclease SbcCD ATPase subunit
VIPQRVKLKGFLCYKEEQEISFDGNATLWMLSGLNGSGKSSVFDGVTYALFGHHRGGSQNAVELINKDTDGLLVEFDFLLDGKAYRAKRTYRRTSRGGGSGTQQLFRYEPGSNGHGSWQPLPDTQGREGFRTWVDENIGLNYETFTSSVLLLQGKAEKLLDSTPSGRHQVLAGIVGLERYKQLHEWAVEERKRLELRKETLCGQLAAVPAVAPEQLAEAEERITTAQEARDAARAALERLQELEFQARAWQTLQGKLAEARRRCEGARRLLGDAPAIEAAVERLRQLREVLRQLPEVVHHRGQVHAAERELQKLHEHKVKLAEQLAQREHALAQARDKRASLQNLLAQDESRQRDVAGRLLQCSELMVKLREYDRQEADLADVRRELAELAPDPAGAVAHAHQACDRLSALALVVPALARLHTRREDLRQARAREQSAQHDLQQVQARGKQRAGEVERLKPLAEEAGKALQLTGERVAETRTLLQSARESLQQVSVLDGAKVCRACGQALTPGHVREEKRRRGAEVKQAEARHFDAEATQRQAKAEEQRLRGELAAAEKAHQDARLEYRDVQNRGKQAHADVERLQAECAAAWDELPDDHRARVCPAPPPDWAETAYPCAEEVEALRAEATGLPAARGRLAQAEQVQQRWAGLKAQESATLAAVARLRGELPSDHQALRQQHAELEARDRALEHGLKAQRASLREADGQVEQLARQREEAQGQLARHDTQVKGHEVVRHNAEHSIAALLKVLPADWRPRAEKAGMKDVNELSQERDELDAAGTDSRGRELEQAKNKLDDLERDQQALETEAEKYPDEARQDPAAVAALLADARRDDRLREDELGAARNQRTLLETYRQQREQIEQESLKIEGELVCARLLADLLGRDRLQLYLVRQAERQVVEYANAVLDRLSGGQLYLKLSGEANGEGNAAKALELEAYNRGTGEKAINVAFLSGSQKFRVAVSLALGIGQYASRQHRPIEAVIIDEGFGCLDSQGRQVMIQELQNLRNQMRCILLVSHQEEFADAFPDGFQFFLEGGSARIRPFQK